MGSSKTTGLQKFLAVLEGEPLEEILTQPSLGTSRPAEVGQVVTHLLDEFHVLFYKVVLQEITDVGVSAGRSQAMPDPTGLDSCSSLREGRLP